MWRYIGTRFLFSIPALILICVLSFCFYKLAPGDPIDNLLELQGISLSGDQVFENYEHEYLAKAHQMGFDLPVFYLSVTPHYWPDTLHKIVRSSKRYRAKELLRRHQNWPDIQNFLHAEKELQKVLLTKADSLPGDLSDIKRILDDLSHQNAIDGIIDLTWQLEKAVDTTFMGSVNLPYSEFLISVERLNNQQEQSFIRPKLHWYGIGNQFHFWMKKALTGNFGQSVLDGRSVSEKIFKALSWTFTMVILTIILSFTLSIPLGIYSAKAQKSTVDQLMNGVLYIIYGVPLFWFATLMVVFFTTDEYGSWTHIFPSAGINFGAGNDVFEKILLNSQRLILPVFCMCLHSMAYLVRQVRSAMIEEIGKDYTLAALARGLKMNDILWKHNFPNISFPLITILTGAIPGAMVGSLVIEIIFNIPGMGRLMYDSIFSNDWPVLYATLLIYGLVTIISYLAGDIFYGFANPKIRFQRH